LFARLHRVASSLRADAVAADLYGPKPMISALRKIEASGTTASAEFAGVGSRPLAAFHEDAFAHMYIHNPLRRMGELLSTHPTIDARVEALRERL